MQSILPPQDTTATKSHTNKVSIVPISSISLLVVFGDTIDITINQKVMALHFLLKQKKLSWIKELTPAYASLGITYDLHFIKSNYNFDGLVFDWVKNAVERFLQETMLQNDIEKDVIDIPVCFGGTIPNDLPAMSKMLDLPVQKIIDIFLNKIYHVFMLGFLPGFSYMGKVSSEISVPRKTTPIPIKAGAVGIAGSQTGIYPLDSLGGWHILGHTPFKMFDHKSDLPTLLCAGNKVKFYEINEYEYFMINNKIIN